MCCFKICSINFVVLSFAQPISKTSLNLMTSTVFVDAKVVSSSSHHPSNRLDSLESRCSDVSPEFSFVRLTGQSVFATKRERDLGVIWRNAKAAGEDSDRACQPC
jgi:hypothetical protein